ncbi:TetR/AcrR family transcriptional regulator [Mesonia maritima]|uniref:TetR/AcrR family transcriptional regulator n=1 Tax=Mesonia maritima TaxID=1793873 RepID=UPI00362A4231
MISERKKEIITIAAKLFKEKGYNAVSMRDLAQELGIKQRVCTTIFLLNKKF